MPSEKLTKILLAISPFTAEEIESMSEGQGWQWVRSRSKKLKPNKAQVCFTGFGATERAELHRLAISHNMEPVTSCTVKLVFLVTGSNAGPAKIAKAKAMHVLILSRQQYETMLETGEIPEDCL